MENEKVAIILPYLKSLYSNADCELDYRNAFELLIAVILSAQTTDVAVNKVTPKLFKAFPTPQAMANADVKEIEPYLKSIGLYKNKAININKCAQELVIKYHGEVPESFKALTSLAGVGRKTANVVRAVYFNIPSIPVDTHVERVSKRLGLAKFDDEPKEVEKKLKRKISRNDWIISHYLFIFFGRYKCKAKNPLCDDCKLKSICKKDKFEKWKQAN